MNDVLIRLESITRLYTAGDIETSAIQDVSLTLAVGEYLAITGASGSGKSTLLSIMSLVDCASSGHMWFNGT